MAKYFPPAIIIIRTNKRSFIKNKKTNKEYLYTIFELSSKSLIIEELEVKGRGYFKKLHFIKSKS